MILGLATHWAAIVNARGIGSASAPMAECIVIVVAGAIPYQDSKANSPDEEKGAVERFAVHTIGFSPRSS